MQNCKAPLKVVIIGCGWIAGGYDQCCEDRDIRTHAKAYALNKQTELVAASDIDRDRLDSFANAWGIDRIYSDARKMLEAHSPDIVSICSPDETHYDMLKMCLEFPSVRGVWCEKPLATGSAECAVLLKKFHESKVALLVNYIRSFSSDYLYLKKRLLAEEFGKVQKLCIFYTKGIMHNGSHAMDILLDWFGEPDSMSVTHAFIDFDPEDPTVDAGLTIHGIPIYFIGLNESDYSFFEMEIYTEKARISLEEFGSRLVIRKVSRIEPSGHKVLGQAEEIVTNLGSAIADALSCLVDAIHRGGIEINGKRALKGIEITAKLANLGKQVNN